MRIQTKAQTQIKQPAAQILQGPEHRDDGYQMREEYGMPMNNSTYTGVKDTEKAYSSNADQYKQSATSSLQTQVDKAKSTLAGVKGPSIPAFNAPAETVIWAGGDGDKPQKYVFPSSAVPEILKSLSSSGYYGVKQNSDGSYGVSFKEYGEEGYTALNKAQQQYQDTLNDNRNAYNQQKSAAEGAFSSQMKDAQAGISEAESGGYSQIDNQYQYLSSLFGKEMASEAQAWQKKMNENSQATQNLVDGGILVVKKPTVI